MKTEKDACSPLNIFKQNQLSKQLATLTEEIEELKSDKNFLLSKLGCKTESDITRVEKSHKHNIDVSEKLKTWNVDLKTEYKTEKASYIKIKNNIPPENFEAVQEERTIIQADGIHQTRIALEQTYREKFDDDIFMEAQNIVNSDLSEKPLRQSVIQQLNQKPSKRQRSIQNKHKNHEIER